MKETTATLIIIIILILIAAGGWWYFSNQQNAVNEVTVMDEFPGKVVYTTDTSLDSGIFEADCSARSGTFNSCGTTCAPGAAACAQVCAYTCEWSTEIDTPFGKPSTWNTYANPDIGFSINYPSEMELKEQEGKDDIVPSVAFSFTGEATTTEEQSDLIEVTVTKTAYLDGSFKEYVEKQATSTDENAVVTEPKQIDINQRKGFTYTITNDEKSLAYVMVPVGENVVLVITHTLEDPNNVGYQSVIDGMLSTLEIFAKL